MSNFPHSPTTHRMGSTEPKLNQQNSTALKWGSDGELSQLDLERILNLLSQADPVAGALMGGRADALG
jgi:hypothetical protein